jgi:hypothetical protein
MFAVLAAWRTVDARLRRAPGSSGAHEALRVLRTIPTELRETFEGNELSPWLSDPARMRGLCRAAIDALAETPLQTISSGCSQTRPPRRSPASIKFSTDLPCWRVIRLESVRQVAA